MRGGIVRASMAAAKARRSATPRTRITTTAAIPGWALRAALALLVGLAGLAAGTPGLSQWVVVGMVALVLAARPHGMLLALGVGVLAAMYVLTSPVAVWHLPVLLLATHLLLVVGALADATSWRGRVEAAVLRDALPSFLTIQVAAQAGGALAALLSGAPAMPWLVVGAVAALAVVTWRVVVALSRS